MGNLIRLAYATTIFLILQVIVQIITQNAFEKWKYQKVTLNILYTLELITLLFSLFEITINREHFMTKGLSIHPLSFLNHKM